jgi:hypothetical protein
MCVMPADSMRAATAKGDFGMSVGQLYHQVTSISPNAEGGANGRCCAQATEKDVRSMSAMGVLSGLVLLTMSFVDLDPKRNCKLRHGSDRRLGPDSFLHIRYAALWRGWSLAQLGWLQCEHGVKIGCTHCW